MKFLDFFEKYKKYIIISTLSVLLLISIIVLIWSLTGAGAAEPVSGENIDDPSYTLSPETETGESEETEPIEQTDYYYENEYVPVELRSNGIDVSKWQGKIEWEKVKQSGVEFAFIRVGYRGENGLIYKDEFAEYNLQQANKYDIKIGVYFFSTAINIAESEEEADFLLDIIAGYPISYPVVYDCEGYKEEKSRMYNITAEERTDIALAFLDKVASKGYQPMHYGSRNDLMDSSFWNMRRIEEKYRVWVALYSKTYYPEKDVPTYLGRFDAWQYSDKGRIDGINTNVDLNVCYFQCEKAEPKDLSKVPTELITDPTQHSADKVIHGVEFYEYHDCVTAKITVNLRSLPSTVSGTVVGTLDSGTFLDRIAMSDKGWSILLYDGEEVFAVSSYLANEVYDPPEEDISEDGFVKTEDYVTAKIETNLRSLPSTEGSQIVYLLSNGEYVKRIGLNNQTGWSMLEHNGSIVYAVTQFLIEKK